MSYECDKDNHDSGCQCPGTVSASPTRPPGGTHIEIVERTSEANVDLGVAVVPNSFRINGFEVLIPGTSKIVINDISLEVLIPDTSKIVINDMPPHDVTTVTATMIVDSLVIKREAEYGA